MEVVASWLGRYMLSHDDMNIPENERGLKATQIAKWFGSADSYDRFRTHARPIRYPELQGLGLRIRRLEDDDDLQDAVLSILHVNEITFNGPAAKIIENHDNRRMVVVEQNIAIQAQPPPQQPTNPPLSRQQRRALERQRRR